MGKPGGPGQWQQDIDILANTIEKYHPMPWVRISQKEFEYESEQLKSNLKNWGNEKITLEILKLVASLQDGHILVLLDNQENFNRWFPLRMEKFTDGAGRLVAARIGSCSSFGRSSVQRFPLQTRRRLIREPFQRQQWKSERDEPKHEETTYLEKEIIMSLRLRDVTNDDLQLIEQWLHADHVRSIWGDPDTNMQLLRDSPVNGSWQAIIEADGRKVGLVLWQHPTRQELDEAGLTDIPVSVIDIDIMIGERTEVGRGVGSAAIRLVAEAALSDPAVPFVMACARMDNLASQRAFAKAGFRNDREFDDVPNGRYVLMVRDRQEAQFA